MKFELNKVYSGDCIDIMKEFPEESIACCVTVLYPTKMKGLNGKIGFL